MKLKLDDKGNAVLQDGKPVYVHDDGKEVAFDVEQTVATIKRLNDECKSHREGKEAALEKLKLYDGIDPEAARKAIVTIKNIDDKKLVDAGKVEEVKAAAVKAAQEQAAAAEKAYAAEIARRDAEIAKLAEELRSEKIGGSFSRSKFIADNLVIPSDMVQARFGHHFKIEEGKVIAYDSAGNKIYSRARPGEVADFDEALETLVDQYPQKDSILKGKVAPGGGAGAGDGGSAKPSKLVGVSLQERKAAIAARFPNLSSG